MIVPAEDVGRKIRIDAFRNPRGTRLHENLFVRDILRDYHLQRVNVVLIVLVDAYHALCVAELGPHVAGQIGFGRFELPAAVLEDKLAVDQLPRHFRFALSGQAGNQTHIHAAGRIPGDSEAVLDGIRVSHGPVRLDGVHLEDIRFRGGLLLRVPIFQRKETIPIRIVLKCLFIRRVVQESILLHKVVVGFVQALPQGLDVLFLYALLLRVQELAGDITDAEHPGDPLRGLLVGLDFLQLAAVVLINLAFLLHIAALLGALLGPLHLVVGLLRALLRGIVHLAADAFKGFGDLLAEAAGVRLRVDGVLVPAVHAAGSGLLAHNHFRVGGKVFVAIAEVLLIVPRRVNKGLPRVLGAGCPLLQDQDIGDNRCSCILFKCRVRQTDRAEKVGLLGDILSDGLVVAVHRVAGRDEHHKAAWTDFIQALGEEIVVDRRRYLLRESPVHNGIVSEGDVADCHVHEVVRDDSFLEALNPHVVLRVQVLGNQAGDVVELHHRPALHLCRHIGRHGSDKVADAAAGFQHTPAPEAELLQSGVHGLDNLDAGIVGIGGAGSGCLVFLIGQQFFQLRILFGPLRLTRIKSVVKSSPADVL